MAKRRKKTGGNNRTFVILGLLAAGVFVAKNWIEGAQEAVSLGLPTFKLPSLTPSGISFSILFPLTNDNGFAIPETSFAGGLMLGNVQLTTLNVAPTAVPANETVDVEVTRFIPYAELDELTIQRITSGDVLSGLSIKGELVSNGFVFNIDERLTLPN